ncbi:hypothetical protein ACFU7T_26340 [Streptomyces sp. NPDC057555]|uniref:hypothetical protein n=1 Tax=Streptomyces sp. NPDC057555 TaxID=3346166 RepID=UPI003673AAAC
MNTPKRRAAIVAGVIASASVVLLGTASAEPHSSVEPATATAQTAAAVDSAHGRWQPPADKHGDVKATEADINADYLISDVAPAQFGGRRNQSHVRGISVTWRAPSGRDPYDGWDWIEILDSHSKRVTWDWACAKDHCDAYGSTLIDKALTKGKRYVAVYWSDGGRGTKGTARAVFPFWA